MAGGGGGDGGYEKRQKEIEQKKQVARDRLNVLFGAGDPTAAASNEVDRNRFVSFVGDPVTMDTGDAQSTVMNFRELFDQAGYDAALANAAADGEQAKARNQNRDARSSLYQTVRDNAFNAGKRRLDEDYADAARKNKFELFARGLAGGSEEIDQNTKLRRTFNDGILDLGGKADAAKAQFRNDDEQTRLQLLQSIDAGMDQGSALSSATNRMAIAADQAAADAQGTALGNVFDTAGLLYSNSQASKGRGDAQEWWRNYSSPGRGQTNSRTGVSTRLPGE